eukprot:3837473-Pleurochrysis_carterae.AAC.1
MRSGVPPCRDGLTHPSARRAGGPAFVCSVRFPQALPSPRLRGAHVRALSSRRSSFLQARTSPLSRACCAPRRPDVSAPSARCLRRPLSGGYNEPGGRGCGTCRCEHGRVFWPAGGQRWYCSVGTLAMLAGTPYYLPACSLAASKLRSYLTPGIHSLVPQMDARRWVVGARDAQPDLKPAFALSFSSESSMADALFQCKRANASLRAALTMPSSDSDHKYLRSWINRVGACDLSDLVGDDVLLDSPAPGHSSLALAFHSFTFLIVPPLTDPLPPPKLQPVECYAQIFDSPHELLTPECFRNLQAWLDTLLHDLTTKRDSPNSRARPQPFVRGQACFVQAARGCAWDLRGPVNMPPNFTLGSASPLNV